MEKTSLRRATTTSISILVFLWCCAHNSHAIEIKEIQRATYSDRYLPFYTHFVEDSYLITDDAESTLVIQSISNISKPVYSTKNARYSLVTFNGKLVIIPSKMSQSCDEYQYFDIQRQVMFPLHEATDQFKGDSYYGYSGSGYDIAFFPQWIQPILFNNVLVPYDWLVQPEYSVSYDFYTALDYQITDKATIPEYKKILGEIYQQAVNSNHGMSYPLEMYFRLGDQKTGKYGFMSLSDDKQWMVTTYVAKEPEKLWRVQGSFWGTYEFRIPYWKFLNPRFIIGPYEAYRKDEKYGPDCEIYSLGILDTKGNAINNNIICLQDFDVSLNGRYLIVTGVEDNGKDTKWNGPYPTILYEITYSGSIRDDCVRLRDFPGTSGKILAVLKKGQLCTVLEHSKTRQTIDGVKECWYRIRLSNGVEGWVFGAWLEYW